MNDHYQRLENLFQSAPLNQGIFAGSVMKVGEGQAEYKLGISEKYFHAAHAMHGAIYFKLLDDAAYFAAASLETERFILTKTYQIKFIRPVEEDQLRAVGGVLNHDEKGIVAKSVIYNAAGKMVAEGEGVFVKGPKKLLDLPGYGD